MDCAKESVIAGIASGIQGAGFWVSASLFDGDPFHSKVLVIPLALVGFVYWIGHLEDWSGYEIGGIALFQGVILTIGVCLSRGDFKFAAIILGIFIIGLMIMGSIAKDW